MLIKIMDRNRLEKKLLILITKTNAKLIYIAVVSWLIFRLRKSNYREYIKNKNTFTKYDKKVLPGVLVLRVLASAKKN